MTHALELADIQGNILTAYGRLGFPKGRMIVLTVHEAAAGRAFVQALYPRVTSALRWPSTRRPNAGNAQQQRPDVAVNLAFTFYGLCALGLPTRTLRNLPDEFIDGMAARGSILGDDRPAGAIDRWDRIWRYGDGIENRAHILVSLNAQMKADGSAVDALQAVTDDIFKLCSDSDGRVQVREGHAGADPRYQDLSAILERGADGQLQPVPREHFGLVDAIGDPVFDGQFPPEELALRVVGNGKIANGPAQAWAPLATGEFLLGHPDEAQEISGAAMPLDFTRNGTFMAYRKLHQNVAAFKSTIEGAATAYMAVAGIGERDEAIATLKAKIVGRWSDGVPLMAAPTYAEWQAFGIRLAAAGQKGREVELAKIRAELADFKYRSDPSGAKCPLTSHIRRINTRDALDPYLGAANPKSWLGSALNNRRRILRRGLPYGPTAGVAGSESEQGIVMLNLCASLTRQYEFVQQQWINYGLDSGSGNDTCPLVGVRDGDAKFVIPADPDSGKPPFVLANLPQFVETRGGDYFFVPSMTALRMIGMGIVDPT